MGGKLNARYVSNNPRLDCFEKSVCSMGKTWSTSRLIPAPGGWNFAGYDAISRGDKNDGEATGVSKNRGRAPTTQFQACQRSCGERSAGEWRAAWSKRVHPHRHHSPLNNPRGICTSNLFILLHGSPRDYRIDQRICNVESISILQLDTGAQPFEPCGKYATTK